MKKLLLIALLSAGSLVGASAQGLLGGTIQGQVSGPDGLLNSDVTINWSGGGVDASNTVSPLAPGIFVGSAVAVAGAAGGTAGTATLSSGDLSGGSIDYTLGDPALPAPGLAFGNVTLEAANTGGGGDPVIPEPSTIALGVLGGALLFFRRRK